MAKKQGPVTSLAIAAIMLMEFKLNTFESYVHFSKPGSQLQ